MQLFDLRIEPAHQGILKGRQPQSDRKMKLMLVLAQIAPQHSLGEGPQFAYHDLRRKNFVPQRNALICNLRKMFHYILTLSFKPLMQLPMVCLIVSYDLKG
jgi:hypothetical protein